MKTSSFIIFYLSLACATFNAKSQKPAIRLSKFAYDSTGVFIDRVEQIFFSEDTIFIDQHDGIHEYYRHAYSDLTLQFPSLRVFQINYGNHFLEINFDTQKPEVFGSRNSRSSKHFGTKYNWDDSNYVVKSELWNNDVLLTKSDVAGNPKSIFTGEGKFLIMTELGYPYLLGSLKKGSIKDGFWFYWLNNQINKIECWKNDMLKWSKLISDLDFDPPVSTLMDSLPLPTFPTKL